MPSIAETTLEMIEWVFPEHAGGPGQIHGGRMMEWITKAGTLAASRVALCTSSGQASNCVRLRKIGREI